MATGRAAVARALAALDRARPWHVLDRPVFLIAAPRSGSTLLQDLLAPHPDLLAWPFEAEDAFVAVQPADHPRALGHHWPAAYATPERRRALERELYLGRLAARRRTGAAVGRLERLALRRVRWLDKTPPNVLRVAPLAAMFPTAKFVFLHRDAPPTIASLVESWHTPSAAHASIVVDGRRHDWMMLAPPGWLDLGDAPYPQRAAFQWRAGVAEPLEALEALPADRWVRLSYEDLVAAPDRELRRVLDFAELSHHPDVLAGVAQIGGRGRTSLSAPRPDKWRDRAGEIEPLLGDLAPLRRRLGYL